MTEPILHGTPEWHEARKSLITASEVAAILGHESAYQTPLEVWSKLTGKLEDEPEKDDDKRPWLKWGSYVEPAVAAWYADITGREVTGAGELYIDKEIPWLGATPDFLTTYSDGDGPDPDFVGPAVGPLETKAPNVFKANEWQWEDDIAVQFKCQLQVQMRVMGYDVGTLCAAGSFGIAYADIERNNEFLDRLLDYLHQWRERYVVKDTPPPAGVSDKALLFKLHPKDNGKVVVFDGELAQLAAKRTAWKTVAKDMEERIKRADNTIRQAIGDNTFADAGGGNYLSNKRQVKKNPAMEARPDSEFRVLRSIKKVPSGTQIAEHSPAPSLEPFTPETKEQ